MDLNTGTPIQPPNTQLPPLPQTSSGLPPVSSTPMNASAQDVAKPGFLDPLAMLKQMTGQSPAAPIPTVSEQPVNVVQSTQVTETVTENAVASQPTVTQPPVSSSDVPVSSTPAVVTPAVTFPEVTQPVAPQPDLGSPVVATPISPAQPQEPAVGNISVSGPYEIKQLLDLVIAQDASDLHLVVGYLPMVRIDGSLVTVGSVIITPQIAKELIYSVLPDDKKEQLEVNREVDLAYQHKDAGRFRINAYWQRGYLSAAFRLIPTRIRTIDELKLPDLFHKFTDLEQGLVLVTGPTGHGKSTSLAAVIQEINMKHPKHILTIEDPVEYVFPQQKALVSQRELGDDTHSWKGALRSALREDPDVVLVGEMRDLETISSAITVAETGHLVFATLHTNSAAQTIQRIVNMYPDVQQDEIRSELADVLEAVVAQRLIPVKGGGRRAALEIMLMTPAIRNLIRENKIYQIDNIIRTSLDLGMITLERSLLGLYKEGLIQQEDALRYALDATEMARLLEELV